MSRIYNGDGTNDWISANIWIENNHPENGWFRAYWEKDGNGASLEDTGFGLRWEWEYKDGERADGESKGWWPSGQLKCKWTYKDNKQVGKYNLWHPNGQKKIESYYTDNGVPNGLCIWWYDNGNKMQEFTYVNGKRSNEFEWNRDGSPKKEEKKD